MSAHGYVTIDGRNICRKWLAAHPEAYPGVARETLQVVLPAPVLKPVPVPRPKKPKREKPAPPAFDRTLLTVAIDAINALSLHCETIGHTKKFKKAKQARVKLWELDRV